MGEARGMAYRILLVEDDADFREPLAILLSQDGYHVQAAVNGQEALEGLAGQSYDIIVSESMRLSEWLV
jgi:CheY-like chemotaxis protein